MQTEVSAVLAEVVDAKTLFVFTVAHGDGAGFRLTTKRCLPLAERVPWIVAKMHLLALCAEIIVLIQEHSVSIGVHVLAGKKTT